MKYEEITYGKSVNQITGESWEKVSAKVSIGENENPDECFAEAKRKVGGWLSSNPFDLFAGASKEDPFGRRATITDIQPKIINKEKERIEIAIENCTTLPQLKIYENDSMKYDLVQEYVNKKKALQ